MGILYLPEDLDEWNKFVQGLQSKNRFIPSSETYIASLVHDCLERRKRIAPETSFFGLA